MKVREGTRQYPSKRLGDFADVCLDWVKYSHDILTGVRATLPSALNVMNASSMGKLVQLVTASRLILYHKGRIDPMKDECHYQIKH